MGSFVKEYNTGAWKSKLSAPAQQLAHAGTQLG